MHGVINTDIKDEHKQGADIAGNVWEKIAYESEFKIFLLSDCFRAL